MTKICILCVLLAFVSCKTKTLESDGGVLMYAAIKNGTDQASFEAMAKTIKERFKKYNGTQPEVDLDLDNNRLKIALPGYRIEDCSGCELLLKERLPFYISEVYPLDMVEGYVEQVNELLFANDCYGMFNVEDTMFRLAKEHPLSQMLLPFSSLYGNIGWAEIGMTRIKDTALLMQVFRHPAIQRIKPRQLAFVWKENLPWDSVLALIPLRTHPSGQSPIDESMIADCRVVKEELTDQWALSIELKEEFEKPLQKITSENVGAYLAFIVDKKVLGTPQINKAIVTGEFVIAGDMSAAEARLNAAMLSTPPLKGLVGIPAVEYVTAD